MRLRDVKTKHDAEVYLTNVRTGQAFEAIFNSGPWCVWMHCPDGRWARIMRTWTRRYAKKFIAEHLQHPLVLHSYWWVP